MDDEVIDLRPFTTPAGVLSDDALDDGTLAATLRRARAAHAQAIANGSPEALAATARLVADLENAVLHDGPVGRIIEHVVYRDSSYFLG